MKCLKTQKGISLISLLIGLLISMLCILASLTLYKNLIHVATTSKIDATHDGLLASASLVMQMEFQSAGYGIANADADDIVIDTATAGQKRVLWRFTSDGGSTYTCRGLQEYALTDSSINYRVLRIISPATGCTATVVLTSLTWGTELAVLGRWIVPTGTEVSNLSTYITTNSTLFNFTLANSTCSPYGVEGAAPATHLRLIVEAPSAAKLQGANIALNNYQFCLPNTYPT